MQSCRQNHLLLLLSAYCCEFEEATSTKRVRARLRMRLVSRSQTAIFSFILGREKIGSGTPPIEKAVLASTAIGVGDYWQWLLCNR